MRGDKPLAVAMTREAGAMQRYAMLGDGLLTYLECWLGLELACGLSYSSSKGTAAQQQARRAMIDGPLYDAGTLLIVHCCSWCYSKDIVHTGRLDCLH